jgi:Trypsin
VIGRYNTSQFTYGYYDAHPERIKILEEIQHPNYNGATFSYDMMLLRLDHAPAEASNHRYVRLDDGRGGSIESRIQSNVVADLPNDGGGVVVPAAAEGERMVRVMGWGHTQPFNGEPSEALQKADLNFVPNEVCSRAEESSVSYNGRIFEEMMCTFGSNTDPCFGT